MSCFLIKNKGKNGQFWLFFKGTKKYVEKQLLFFALGRKRNWYFWSKKLGYFEGLYKDSKKRRKSVFWLNPGLKRHSLCKISENNREKLDFWSNEKRFLTSILGQNWLIDFEGVCPRIFEPKSEELPKFIRAL